MQGRSGHRRDILYIALLLLVLCIFRGELLVGKSPAGLDNRLQCIPLYSLTALKPLPLWNPFEFCGFPVLGNPQQALFYPPQWIFRFIEITRIYGIYIFAHLFLSGVGMYFLSSRIFKHRRAAAYIAAAVWMCGTFLQGRLENIIILFASAWIPWMSLACALALQRRNLVSLYIAGATLAAAFHVGSPQGFFYGLLIALWACLFITYISPRKQRRFLPERFCVIILLFIGLSAPLLLPVIEYTYVMQRGMTLFKELAADSLPFRWIPTLFIGGTQTPEYTDASTYFGMTSLFLILATIYFIRYRRLLWYGILLLLGIWLSLGNKGGLYHLFSMIPVVKFLSGPLRALALVAFAGALLTGEAMHTFLNNKKFPTFKQYMTILSLISIGTGFLFLFITLSHIKSQYWLDTIVFSRYVIPEFFRFINLGMWLSLMGIGILLVLFSRSKYSLVSILFILILADLLHFLPRLAIYIEKHETYFAEPDSVQFIKKRNLEKERCITYIPTKLLPLCVEDQRNRTHAAAKLCDYHRIPNATGFDPAMPGLYAQTIDALGLRNSHDNKLRTITFNDVDHPFINVLNIRYILGDPRETLVHGEHITLDPQRASAEIELGDSTKIQGFGLVHLLDQALDVPQGAFIGRVVFIDDSERVVSRVDMHAGIDVADVRAHDDSAAPRHQAIKPAIQWNSIGLFSMLRLSSYYHKSIFSKTVTAKKIRFEKAPAPVIWDINAVSIIRAETRLSFEKIFENNDSSIFLNRDALPFMQWLTRWRHIDTQGSAWETLKTTEPESMMYTALLTSPAEDAHIETTGTATVEIQRKTYNYLAARITSTGGGILRISQLWHPGWKLSINHKPEKLLICDGCLQAATIPSAGSYLIELRFLPTYFLYGIIILVISLLLPIGWHRIRNPY